MSKPVVKPLDKVEDASKPVVKTLDKVEDASKPAVKTLDQVEDASKPVVKTLDKVEDASKPVVKTLDKVEDASKPVVKTLDKVEDTSKPLAKVDDIPNPEITPLNDVGKKAIDGVDSLDDLANAGRKKLLSEGGSKTGTWDMAEGGDVINGREYSQHAMERMAPDTPQVRAELSKRAEKAAKQFGYKIGSKEYCDFCKKYVDPRNIPPSVIENAISSTKAIAGNKPGTFIHETADVKVIVNSSGKVVTVIPK